MDICLVTPDYSSTGGIQTLVQNTESGLRERGHNVDVLFIDSSTQFSNLSDLIPRYIASPADIFRRVWPLRNAVGREMKKRLNTTSYDVIHAMHINCWPALAVANDAATILTVHALEMTDSSTLYRALEFADIVCGVSEFTVNLCYDTVLENDTRLPWVKAASTTEIESRVVYPGINPDYEPVVEKGSENTIPEVVTLSRLVERKNLDTLINAWSELNGHDNWSLTIAGDGPRREALEAQAQGHEDITIVGYVDEKTKIQLLQRARLFALPSTRIGYDCEGFGIVYLEAQAAGTPILASKKGGVPEAVGDAGITVDDETSVDSVAQALDTILSDSAQRQAFATRAAERSKEFSIVNMVTKLEDTYDDADSVSLKH